MVDGDRSQKRLDLNVNAIKVFEVDNTAFLSSSLMSSCLVEVAMSSHSIASKIRFSQRVKGNALLTASTL